MKQKIEIETDYTIIPGECWRELEDTINRYLSAGYHCVGGPFCVEKDDTWFQAIAKREVKDE